LLIDLLSPFLPFLSRALVAVMMKLAPQLGLPPLSSADVALSFPKKLVVENWVILRS